MLFADDRFGVESEETPASACPEVAIGFGFQALEALVMGFYFRAVLIASFFGVAAPAHAQVRVIPCLKRGDLMGH